MMKRLTLMAAALGWLSFMAVPAAAATDEEKLVTNAQFTVEDMVNNKEFGHLVKKFLRNAEGVLIVPNMLKGAFIFGGEGGGGVLLARGKDGTWSYPAFYTLGGVSVGFQIGGSSSQILLLLMTERGVKAMAEGNRIKLGADVGVAAGPVGAGAEAGLTLGSVDVIVYSLSKGAYIGISLEGSVVEPREDYNKNYYGAEVESGPIIAERKYSNPQAEDLRRTLAAAASGAQ